MHIMLNISRSKGNQAVKFGQLIEYKVRNIFFEMHAESEARRLVPGVSFLFFFLKKKLYMISKQVASTFILIYFGRLHLMHTIIINSFILKVGTSSNEQ